MKKLSILAVLIICFVSLAFSADKIILTNGQIVEGKIIGQDASSVTMRFENKSTIKISRRKIKVIEIEEPKSFKMAKALEEKKRFEKAIKLYREIINNYSAYQWAEEAQYRVAACYLGLNKLEETVGSFQSLLKNYPQTKYSLKAKLNIGEIFVKQKKYKEAIGTFKNILKKEKEGDVAARLQYKIGNCYLSSRETEKALNAYLKAALLHYEQTEWAEKALFKSGECYERLGDKKTRHSATWI